MNKIYKPTKSELNDFSETISEYCKKASKARRWLVQRRQVVNRYSNVGVNFDDEYKEKKKEYLDRYAYFELNTYNIINEAPKGTYDWGNMIFTLKEIQNKIKEVENGNK